MTVTGTYVANYDDHEYSLTYEVPVQECELRMHEDALVAVRGMIESAAEFAGDPEIGSVLMSVTIKF